ncbi:CubicO group peptidase, beta-lactamase class C family [Tenacibaculum sp. MAR_2009_124]|uniref:serine hydrolase domain-containing protein n=1 Tax=Tenacibaculum sp. MAR_2009_124 TaxID=1250059 RepID=UPI00089CE279|nr:serine hydrolase domain-containing protein [Tenacibaculum sp. MAR_2009_124]SEC77578.1 CubicO group peptidase, beta-lactamase class C family [Tenacibaculum sp. MAR_2009_124]
MKNGLILVLTICFFTISCDKKHSSKKEPSKKLISDTYKEPQFIHDSRIEKLKSIAPELQEIFSEHSFNKKIPGIAYGIVVDNSLVLASSTGVSQLENNIPVTNYTSFRIASMTKSFTAMAILKLRDEGKLSLNDPVLKYVPEIKSLKYLTEDSPIIDIENLLTMTAGFPEDNPWGDRQLDLSTKSFLKIVSNGLSLSKISSYQYEYSNTGYALLGYIISKVSGVPYQKYITTNILNPLGMKNTYWEYSDIPKEQLASGYRWEDKKWKKELLLHDGTYGAMGGLITSIEDFSKYVSFHLNAWPARNEKDNGPVKRSTLREMHTPQYNFLNSWNKDWNNESCVSMIGYGYGLGISIDCKRIVKISHGGALPGFASNYVFYPQYGIGIMAFGNLTYTKPIPYDKIEKILFERLKLQPRKLPSSNILKSKKKEIASLFSDGKIDLNRDVFAKNFFLDISKDRRLKEIQGIIDKAGSIKEIGEIYSRNQLRGSFNIKCEHGGINVFFTLTPESNPMIQKMTVSYRSNKK